MDFLFWDTTFFLSTRRASQHNQSTVFLLQYIITGSKVIVVIIYFKLPKGEIRQSRRTHNLMKAAADEKYLRTSITTLDRIAVCNVST